MVKALLSALALCALAPASGWAETASPSLIATPPQPQWSELNVRQKIILAPLSDDWDSLEYFRQKKWLGIAERFTTMPPQDQRRIQAQMQEWGKLTPEQRETARENFKAASRLPAEKKRMLRQQWEEYSNLPEEEKEKFKRQAASAPVPRPGKAAVAAPPPAPPSAAPPLAPQTPPAVTAPTASDEVPKP